MDVSSAVIGQNYPPEGKLCSTKLKELPTRWQDSHLVILLYVCFYCINDWSVESLHYVIILGKFIYILMIY